MHSVPPVPPPSPPAERALAALHRVMKEDRNWIGIHAAEALIALGQSREVDAYFRSEAANATNAPHRVGIWRVLAVTAASPAERASWLARIEKVFLDPTAPDRKQAIESLAKLGHRTTGPVQAAARAMADTPPEMNTVLPLWSLHHSGDPAALARLIRLLRSEDAIARQRSAYALRWLQPEGQPVRVALAQAVQAEPAGTPRVFLLSAALVLDADPDRRAVWQHELEDFFYGDQPTGRLEAGYALSNLSQPADWPRLAALLDDADHDRQVAAAAIILHLGARAGPVK